LKAIAGGKDARRFKGGGVGKEKNSTVGKEENEGEERGRYFNLHARPPGCAEMLLPECHWRP
jgi:hypothetical protein